MARSDRSTVGAGGRVLLGPAHFFHGAMGDGQVDFARGRARGVRWEAETAEQCLRHTVMPLVLEQRATSTRTEPAFPPVALDQSQLLERGEVAQRRRRSHTKGRSDELQGCAPPGSLVRLDGPKDVQLSPGKLLKGLHIQR